MKDREIKFRVWIVDLEKMLYSGDNSGYWDLPFQTIIDSENPLMQFTGLHDKNGKEIYFGDILVTSNDGKNGDDVWDREEFGTTVVRESRGALGVDYSDWDMGSKGEDSIYSSKYAEVIGNIYENSELLTQTNKR